MRYVYTQPIEANSTAATMPYSLVLCLLMLPVSRFVTGQGLLIITATS